MPRVSRGPHLYLKRRSEGESFWYVRDGKRRVATGCGARDVEGARQALERYIGKTARPQFGDGDPTRVKVAAVVILYATDTVPGLARPEEAATRLQRITEFFGRNTVADITPSSCAAYTRWRTHQGEPAPGEPPRRARAVAGPSARRELADLQSALNHAWKSRKLMVKIPVALPDASPPRERWLTPSEAARLLWGCLGWTMAPATVIKTRAEIWVPFSRMPERINRHAARFVLLGLKTGTRHDSILGLGWHEHVGGGWADLQHGLLYRRAPNEVQTKKRKPPIPIPDGLLRHMRRWKRVDGSRLYIVSWDGQRIAKLRRSFASAVRLAGLDDAVTPHILRHTCATWLVQRGVSLWEVAGFLGMTVEMIQRVYGHHAPDHLSRAARAVR